MTYPPSHRSVDDPQPEFCELCGLKVGAAHLAMADVQGLRGVMVCDVTPNCLQVRSSPSYDDRKRTSAIDLTIGQSRVFPPGGPDWEDP